MAKAKPAAEHTPAPVDIDTKRPSLRDLDEADGVLQEFLKETEGEVTPEIESLEAWLAEATITKILQWGLWLRNREAEREWLVAQAAPYKTEADRIMGRANALTASIERSEAYLLRVMQQRNIPFVRSPLIEVKIASNPPHVVGDDKVPVETLEKLFDNEATRQFVRYTPAAYALDKNAVKNAVKLNILPEELVKAGVGTLADEKIVVK